MQEIPNIASSSHSHSSYSAGDMMSGHAVQAGNMMAQYVGANNQFRSGLAQGGLQAAQTYYEPPKKQEIQIMVAIRRLVQVFIADPDENVPLDTALIYSGEQKFTDLTDQELFFEVDIKSILATHNDKRAKIINKKVKERTEHLEPARIRDLKMTVVNIAAF